VRAVSVFCVVVAIALAWCGSVRSQDSALAKETDAAEQLPKDPAAWINSPPLNREMLCKKGVLLVFFEESCPWCASQWPVLMKLSQDSSASPVLFVAVNSGNPRSAVEAYVREHKITWPVIVDPDRSLEERFGIGTISLKNITQWRVIRSSGEVRVADWRMPETSVESASQGAIWNVDPAEIPAELNAAWRAVEFGNFPAAAAMVVKGTKSGKPNVKQGAESLLAFVQSELDRELAAAKEAMSGDKKWEAFKINKRISTRFRGYALPDRFAESLKSLEKAPVVEKELKAQRILSTAEKALDGSAGGRRKAMGLVEKLRKDYPDSEAARLGEQLVPPT
jgi:thiol-disulfide isomerase/thioredoxin